MDNEIAFVQDEFNTIYQILTQRDCSQLASAPRVLMLLDKIAKDTHPSGYPDPALVNSVIGILREEKFREVRERGRHAPIAAEIQVMIIWLKEIHLQAKLARPKIIPSTSWASLDWDPSLYGVVFWVFWLILQIVIMGACYLIYPSPNASITCLTVANVILLLMSFACKSLVGLIITSTQIAGYFIAMAIVYFMHL